MTKASDNVFPKLLMSETTTPSSPAASSRALWVDANKVLYWKSSAGLDSPLAALNKWNATAAPAVTDDSGDGYSVGSRWIDTTNDKEYVALDVTVGAAVWTETTAGGGADVLPWHVSIIPMIWTPDAVSGSWSILGVSDLVIYPFYQPESGADSGNATLLFSPGGGTTDAIAYDVILAAGTWDAHFHVRKSTNTGIITLNQDGASQGTVDTYAAAAAYAKVSITGWTVATTGKKRMQLAMATKNASSSDYVLGVVAIEFRRTA